MLARRGFTAGPIDTRVDQLHDLFADPAVAAIACARGGAGVLQLLPHLDRDLLQANPKLLLGYSDITLLHLELERLGIVSLHGPMVARELADGDSAYDRASLWHGADGRGSPLLERARRPRVAREREGRGRAAGRLPVAARGRGRDTLGAAQHGRADAALHRGRGREAVPSRPDARGSCGPRVRCEGVTGVVFGDMKGCTPGFHDDYRLEDVLLEALEGLDVPVALGLSSGHTTHPNLTLPLGVRARLECWGEEARFDILEAAVE